MPYIDQLQRSVNITGIPQRIVSVVPSQTELLYDLGLDKEVVGITKFCVHPQEWFRNKTRVGGTKKLDLEKIKSLNPDLILANKEENTQEQIEELSNHFPVWISDVNNLDDALKMIHSVGIITNKNDEAQRIISKIKEGFQNLQSPISNLKPSCYLIWQEPFMTIGSDTFINDMMKRAGFQNVFENLNRYPEITLDQINLSTCQFVLLSSEPFPFKQKHAEDLQQKLPLKKIILVDGEFFSWYGSRLVKAAGYFRMQIADCRFRN